MTAKLRIQNLADLINDYEADGKWAAAHKARTELEALKAAHPDVVAEIEAEAETRRAESEARRAAAHAGSFVARGID
jgi:hypothetical protein